MKNLKFNASDPPFPRPIGDCYQSPASSALTEEMMRYRHAPTFYGIWRTETAAFHFRADGTFELLHAPSTGTFEVMRDAEWTRRPVTSKTGYLLLTLIDARRWTASVEPADSFRIVMPVRAARKVMRA